MVRFWKYIEQVKSEEVITNEWIKKAVERFEKDYSQIEEGDYPYYFDEDEIQKVINFVEELKHIKGELAGSKIKLEPWQVFYIGNVYGWKKKENGKRRFKKSFLFIARKNGKTLLGSALQVYDLLTEDGAEVYSIATTKQQANLSFENCRNFVKYNADLKELLTTYQYHIYNPMNEGKITSLSSEYGTHDGLNVSFCLADEVSAHKDYNAINVIRSGMKSRVQPLLLMITTAGYSTSEENAGYGEFELSKKLLNGLYEDDSFFPLLYCLDEDDDWLDANCYIKANPNLGVSIKLETLIEEQKEAIQKPTYKSEFYTKTLNRFLKKSSKDQWFSIDVIHNLKNEDFRKEKQRVIPVMGSIDLSKRIDFTAYTKMFYDKELNKYYVKHKFYIPEEQVDEKFKNDISLIHHWIERGYITTTKGSTIDYDYLINDVMKDKQDLPLYNSIVYDEWASDEVVKELSPHFRMIAMGMNTKSISNPAKKFEVDVLNRKIIDNNPVSHWMYSNAKVYTDYAGNIKIQKIDTRHDSRRIDGLITSIMAHSLIQNEIKKKDVGVVKWGNVKY